MTLEGYRFVRVLLSEELAEKCDSFRTKHHMSWDELAEKALSNLVNPPLRSRREGR
jgi:hypothetical protein